MSIMEDEVDVRAEAVKIITEVLGSPTAQLYSTYYADKSVKEILTSLNETLTEYVGQRKSDEIVQSLYNRYRHIKP